MSTGIRFIVEGPSTRPRRRALTLAEVLIAMGVLAIGLLGVAAVFPVGGFYMQSGDIADRAGMVAQLALEDAIIRGHLDPENWLAHDADVYSPTFSLADPNNGLLCRPLQQVLRRSLASATAPVLPPGANGTVEQYRATFYGGAYAIDPIGFGAALADRESGLFNDLIQSSRLRGLPGVANTGWYRDPGQPPPAWVQWNAQPGLATWPVRRVTTTLDASNFNFYVTNPTWSRGRPAARSAFSGDDDLALTLPSRGDNPARQQVAQLLAAGDLAGGRVAESAFSWILTVAPASPEARDALATAPDSHPYDVSAAVFHKRQVGRGADGVIQAERLVAARVVTASDGGGELLLERLPDTVDESPFENLRAGQFVMVVGPHPLSSATQPRLALRWCRVLTIDDDGQPRLPGASTPPVLDRDNTVLVTLRGPDWPWRANPADAGGLDDTARLSNDLRVAIVPGVVAVHTRTMRLEGAGEWAID